MRLVAPAVAVVLLLAACGSGTPRANGEASKSATQVIKDAQKALASASSFRVVGHNTPRGTDGYGVDLTLSKSKGGIGSIDDGRFRWQLVRIRHGLYVQGDLAMLEFFDRRAASMLIGKWLKGSDRGQLGELTALTQASTLFSRLQTVSFAFGRTLKNRGETTYRGERAVEIESGHHGKLYVAATGPPYPIAFVAPAKEHGRYVFRDYNATVQLEPPRNPLSLAAYGS